MVMLRLGFPALLEQEDSSYVLRPLLNRGPVVRHERYSNLIGMMIKAIRENFQHGEISEHNQESLLWYKFSPDYKFENIRLIFRSGMYHIDGVFSMATYTVGKYRYACFPRMNYLTLRIPSNVRHRPALIDFLHDVVSRYFREERKEQLSFNPKEFYSKETASTIDVSCTCEMKNSKFAFEESARQLWAYFGHEESFDGAKELEKVAEDLSVNREGNVERCLFRDSETAWVKRALFSDSPQAIVLVGPRGIGKSSIVREAYQNYRQDNPNIPPYKLQKLWLLDPLRVISGMSVVGQWERRFESILIRIKNRLKGVIKKSIPDVLYIENPLALLRIGKTAQTSLTLAHLMMPMMDRRNFSVVLEARPEEWEKFQEMNRSFADMFQVLRVKSLDEKQTHRIISQQRAALEQRFQCEFSSAAITTLKKIEPQFRGVKELPGSIVDIMRDVAVKSTNKRISESWIYQSIQENFHIHKKMVDRDVTLSRVEVEQYFKGNLIGQPEAKQVLVDTILSIKANLCTPGKPLNTMLFIGPTGVGKTEAVKQLAQYLYAREESLVRIDMNEFIDDDAICRLVGDITNPYGILTERVRYQKSCVLLLDEVEKAHPRVHDILLQLLDDGRLTDAAGNTTDFSQCIVIMTSNVGAQDASSHMGFVQGQNDLKASYLKSLENSFRPELINRINNIVVFDALKLEDMIFLSQLHLKKLLCRDGFLRRSTILNVEPTCLEHIAKQGFDPKFGARALKRNIENLVTHAIAAQLAEIDTDDPVILNMWLKKDRAVSAVTRLKFIEEPVSALPANLDYGLKEYESVQDKLLELDQTLRKFSEQIKLNEKNDRELEYLVWTLSDAVRDIAEPLQTYIYELEERITTQNLRVRFTYLGSQNKSISYYRSPRMEFSTIHAALDVKEYLASLYHRATPYFGAEKTNQFGLWAEVNRLSHGVRCANKRGLDRGIVIIKTLVANRGREGVEYLKGVYISLLNQLSRVDIIREEAGAVALSITGAGLSELFTYETGVHLFYEDDGAQVPVILKIFDQTQFERDSMFNTLSLLESTRQEILRVYALDRKNRMKDSTITDVRTKLMTSLFQNDTNDGWWNFLMPAFKDELGAF